MKMANGAGSVSSNAGCAGALSCAGIVRKMSWEARMADSSTEREAISHGESRGRKRRNAKSIIAQCSDTDPRARRELT